MASTTSVTEARSRKLCAAIAARKDRCALRLGEIFRRRAFHPRNHLAVLRLDHVHLKVRQPVVHQERHVASRALARLERRVVAVTSSFPRRALFSSAKRPGWWWTRPPLSAS